MNEQLTRVTFSTEELRSIPKIHSGFFVSSCLAMNEISLSLRLFLMCLNTRSTDRPIKDDALKEYAFAQFQMIERSLGAKCIEYLNMLGDYQTMYLRKRDKTMATLVDPMLEHVKNFIRVGSAYELALWYRNTATSHYVVSKITELLMEGDLADEHSIYLHSHSGNANYLLGEQILLGKLAEGGKDVMETANALKEYGLWVEETAKYVVDIHHKFSVFFLKTFFPGKSGQALPIDPEPHLVARVRDTALPILWNFAEAPPEAP